MILSFDVDCGELVPGHCFVARGLAGPYRLQIPGDWDGDSAEYEQMLDFEDAGGYPGLSLEYELVPGVSQSEAETTSFVTWPASRTRLTRNCPGIPQMAVPSPRSRAVRQPTDRVAPGHCRQMPRS